jgi:hypothetical protein
MIPDGRYEDEYGVYWYLNAEFHRDDGLPAIEWANGTKSWYKHGVLHRTDGPAIDRVSGVDSWYIDGKIINAKTNEEFLQLMKMKAFW